jgi:DnaK suppressor protein
MDKATVEHFKNLFTEILSEEESIEAQLAPTPMEGDEGDILMSEKENQMDFRLKSRTSVFMKKVRKSLQKIEDGSFGECEECGSDISRKRLLARPTADLCIACKEDQEREENQLVHKNRTSVVQDGRTLPIEHLMARGYGQDETSTTAFGGVSHMSYQDVV